MCAAASSGVDSKAMPPVVCVIINWNGWRDTIECVHSVLAQNYSSLEVVIVDNASTDDSVERIRSVFPAVRLVEAASNRGYAAGCNLGIGAAQESGAAFVWLLNNDTIAPAETLRKLANAAIDPRTGIVGTVLRYMHEPQRTQAWGGGVLRPSMGFVTHLREPTALGPNSFLTFASVLLRTAMIESIGPLDEGFFMYFEDSEMCFRARAAGWRLAVAADTAVLHREGGSSTTRRSARLDRIVTASGLRFLDRYGRPRWAAKPLFVLSRVARRMMRGDLAGVRAVLRGVRDWRRRDPLAFQEER